jgi:glutaminase
VDREPSGQAYNALVLTPDGLPHNPFINTGGLICCALIGRDKDPSERFDMLMNWVQRLSGGIKPSFSNSTYLSERNSADRNFAIAYMMRDANVFPAGTNLVDVLEFYFQVRFAAVAQPTRYA